MDGRGSGWHSDAVGLRYVHRKWRIQYMPLSLQHIAGLVAAEGEITRAAIMRQLARETGQCGDVVRAQPHQRPAAAAPREHEYVLGARIACAADVRALIIERRALTRERTHHFRSKTVFPAEQPHGAIARQCIQFLVPY